MDAWLIAVEESLQDDRRSSKPNKGLIHCVPKSLSNRKTGVFYVPQVMSIGPYHFKPGSNVRRDEVESLKTEVSRKMHQNMSKEGLNSVIELFKGNEKLNDIKRSYVKEFPIAKNVWGWMIARDACFLLEVLYRFSGDYKRDESKGRIESDESKGRIERDESNDQRDESKDRIESDERDESKDRIESDERDESKDRIESDENKGCIEIDENKGCIESDERDESKGRIESDESKGRIVICIGRIHRFIFSHRFSFSHGFSENQESDESKGRIVSSLSRIHGFSENPDSDESNAMSRIDGILSRKRHHPLLNDIVKDMFKMENQIPYWTLDKIRDSLGIPQKDEGFIWFESSLKNLSPVEVGPLQHRKYTETHILQLLHDFIVDRPTLDHSQPIRIKPNMLLSVVSSVSLIWKAVICILILFLFPLFTIWLLWHWLMLYCRRSDILIERKGSVPTAEELKSVGVKFKRLKSRGIYHIYFNSNSSTLYLPKFNVDDRCEGILRNLMALEICSEQEEKPITRYVILMNDLINTSRDVAILRREDIIAHKLGSDEEVAQLWNSIIVSSCTEVRYSPINDASCQINRYVKKWWKVLWAQFRMAHCSKPWLVLSLFAGISLLLLTLMQVVCLFRSCLVK